ncbi:VOC family protein [Cellulophaga sp. 20_2_10]|uniref:VOC family protein n=1 Tax=Cellulophaga sp. 20_2_10 TaxID=2942476 RepID=UPI00201AD903|nr:VOC family protein [Cellulophaga sp. 20_2_10]MCL5245187.1 VOC family protein [Cellulophaga sp. 20_2_10]
MNRFNYILILVLIFSVLSCKDEKTDKNSTKIIENISTDLQLDHFNFWVENPTKAKERLIQIGFTSVPDSLSQIHKGQGTAGRYFNFLNVYLELIFVYDQKELEENNEKNKDLDFTKRANFKKNGASPFSIALKVKDYNIEKIPFEKVRYHQEWMDENSSIYSAKNSKKHIEEPSIFVIYPEIESDTFQTLADLINIPDEYAFAREFYKHPNGAQKVSKIIITSSNLNLNTETIKAVNGIENLTVKSGKEHVMEVHFDNDIQKKSFDLRPELPLIIYL